jgi:hypothetical protein
VVDAGWRGDHPVFHPRVVDDLTCMCGARRMVQHNLGCPIREADDQRLRQQGIGTLREAQRTVYDPPPPPTDAINSARFAKESAERKAAPLWSGVMLFFPDALMAVARLSKKANDKHNPGMPLHWSKEKSNDHGDCLTRHQLEPEKMDEETQEIHAVHVAWRALAQLQIIIERQHGEQA